MKRIGPVSVALVIMVFTGAANLQAAVNKESKKSSAVKTDKTKSAGAVSNKSAMSATPSSYISDQVVGFLKRKSGKELMEEKKKESDGTKVARGIPVVGAVGGAADSVSMVRPIPAVSSGTPKVYKPVMTKVSVPPPPPKVAPQVDQVRQEVQKIIDLNRQIKTVQSSRVGQFQRIQEQARMHQKILDQLEPSQELATGKKTPGRADLLSQEKLRVIHEETTRNETLIADMTGGTSAKSQKAKQVPNDIEPIIDEGSSHTR